MQQFIGILGYTIATGTDYAVRKHDANEYYVANEWPLKSSRLDDPFIAIDRILYSPRHSTVFATMKNYITEVMRLWKGIVIMEGGGWKSIM